MLDLFACKPYNSTEKNEELLQGKWHLQEIRYAYSDEDNTDSLRDTVHISFIGDSIIEQINGNFINKGLFNIQNYKLQWLQEDSSSVDFHIILLNDSAFSMRSAKNNNIWMFIKEKAE